MQKEDFKNRCARLHERLVDADFLANKGLGNEAGIWGCARLVLDRDKG